MDSTVKFTSIFATDSSCETYNTAKVSICFTAKSTKTFINGSPSFPISSFVKLDVKSKPSAEQIR